MFGKYERVLIVDDCEFQRRTLSKGLRTHGYTVQTAVDGVDALKLVADQQFDFVITDWDMPNLDGELLCRCLRSQLTSDRYIYIIMMTGHTERADVVASFAAGVDDFITKPINLPELLARMQAGNRVLDHDRRLSYVAERDPLTGLLNQRSLIPRLTAAVADMRRQGRTLSVIRMDLDHLKRINQEFGRAASDEVLLAVSECMINSFRAGDDVYRYGGEEFLVVLPATNADSAIECADRCGKAIRNLDLSTHEISEQLTASFGVAELQLDENSIIELLERADAALMQAKKRGHDCTVLQPSPDNAIPVAQLTA